jgi:hypothetical protein
MLGSAVWARGPVLDGEIFRDEPAAGRPAAFLCFSPGVSPGVSPIPGPRRADPRQEWNTDAKIRRPRSRVARTAEAPAPAARTAEAPAPAVPAAARAAPRSLADLERPPGWTYLRGWAGGFADPGAPAGPIRGKTGTQTPKSGALVPELPAQPRPQRQPSPQPRPQRQPPAQPPMSPPGPCPTRLVESEARHAIEHARKYQPVL